jgi:hypothetical protein
MMSVTKLQAAHERLREALTNVMGTWQMVDEASTDTCLAIGEAAGIISKAKGLLGRDIDQMQRQ